VNAARFCRLVGCFQSTMAVSFMRSGRMPFGPTLAPAKMASVMKKLDFVADRESPFSLTHVSSVRVFWSIRLKSSPTIPPSSTNSSKSMPTRSPSACAVISANVDGAPVNPNGIHL
jgi:hypothetical protein